MNQLSTSLAEKLLARSGKTVQDLAANSTVGRTIRAHGVRRCAEFERIRNLPRRDWESDPELALLTQALTDELKTPTGTMSLRPHQAVVLMELHDYRRSLAAAKVSAGKTLISFLAPTVLESKRPLLLVPAKLVEKTRRDFRALAEHWNGCRTIEILSYEKLSLNKWSDFLTRFQPDLIIADEAHKLRILKSARTKRVKRYMKEFPETVFLPLSGTLARRSLLEIAHISEWALKEFSPVPRNWSSLDEWRRALDEKMRDGERMAPGVLLEFGGPELQTIREGYATWRAQTPGWISVTSGGVDCSLIVDGTKFDGFPSHVDEKFEALRGDYATPDGEVFLEPSRLWQYLKQLSLGFWYRLDPKPPEAWREARRAWGQFVRDIISRGREGLDTELQVALACAQGRVRDNGLHAKWKGVKPLYDPDKHRHTEWVDLSFVEYCEDWLNEEKGVLFCPYRAFGEKLKERGWPYFGQQGVDKDHGLVDAWKGGPAVASYESCKEGRNLQQIWNQAMVAGGLTNSADAEQLLGRLHRSGQSADEVTFRFPFGCLEAWESLTRARTEAKFSCDESHKLLVCDWLVPSEDEAMMWSGSRWCKT